MSKNIKLLKITSAAKELCMKCLIQYQLNANSEKLRYYVTFKSSGKHIFISAFRQSLSLDSFKQVWILSRHSIDSLIPFCHECKHHHMIRRWWWWGVFICYGSTILPHQRAVSYKHGAHVSFLSALRAREVNSMSWLVRSQIPTGWSKWSNVRPERQQNIHYNL